MSDNVMCQALGCVMHSKDDVKWVRHWLSLQFLN